MATLIPLSQLVRDHNYDLSGVFDPTGLPAYAGNDKVGTVRGALSEDGGRLRYLILDVGGWFSAKEVLVPVGLARIEDDGVYVDSMTKDQVKAMSAYHEGQEYTYDTQVADERVLRGSAETVPLVSMPGGQYDYRDHDAADTMYKTPQRLRLLEERLQVNKQRAVAGSVEIGKRVETRTENVNVGLEHEELVIERTPVSEPRPVDGTVRLGDASETVRVDLEAETAQLNKQAFVTEEVEIGKRTVTEQQTLSDTVGREVLDVTKTGDVVLDGETPRTATDGRAITADDTATATTDGAAERR
ncbi:uncharacterized protein (TIGR02271 family) [Deinococcus metalli]|uniref:Uncharacterized protein (TIGR02271 family) n=1 Tax=Deinococcus metalli TaxID=1141878 RepID=A0A7W8NS14_9DEIO|nr:DUF2382 domain-containing protein [Deinococcus metalli]MBB5376687.1 uncharacterized protein (TIGR02271 family) [Deinococcus metalli]GHF65882.1 hypothetical protein GCM10017781_47020 [Deinococcus metalli]